jgi:hypothetical protein
MSHVPGLLRKVARLFFDDGSLAIAALVVLAATAILMDTAWFDGSAAMAFLVGGVTAALLKHAVRTARVTRPRD